MFWSKSKPRPILPTEDIPWWQRPAYIRTTLILVFILLDTYSDFKRGEHIWDLARWVAYAFLLLMFPLGSFLYKIFLASWIEDAPPAPAEGLPSPICPHCGYDVRATLMRCPECGHDTPFKVWLDRQNPLERALFEKRLAPRAAHPAPHDAPPIQPEQAPHP